MLSKYFSLANNVFKSDHQISNFVFLFVPSAFRLDNIDFKECVFSNKYNCKAIVQVLLLGLLVASFEEMWAKRLRFKNVNLVSSNHYILLASFCSLKVIFCESRMEKKSLSTKKI